MQLCGRDNINFEDNPIFMERLENISCECKMRWWRLYILLRLEHPGKSKEEAAQILAAHLIPCE